MGNFLGSLLGSASSLVGGIMGQQNTAAINQQNINNQDFLAGGGELSSEVANAKAAGLNPLAVLGNISSGGGVVSQPSNSAGQGVADAGQNIQRAMTANADANDKTTLLNQQLIQAQIDNKNADTWATLHPAVNAQTFAAPGSSPGLPASAHSIPGNPPLYQDYSDGRGGKVTLYSKGASEAVMNSASLPMAPILGWDLVGRNLSNAWDNLRPDVVRAVQNVGGTFQSIGGYGPAVVPGL